MTDKITALIRQTWYEAAKRNLKAEDRLRFYEICFEYEFYDVAPTDDVPFAARLLFDMVKNDIEKDKQRIKERAERARQNGRAGGRPKNTTESNEENENPKNPVGFEKTIYTIQNNTIQNNTKQSLSPMGSDTEDTHTFFSICLDFFDRGASTPVDEANTFWNYYEARGWKTSNGAEIVDKLALARAWRLKDCSAAAMKRRLAYSDLLHKANPTEPVLISDFVDCIRNATTKKVEIAVLHQSTAIILDNKYLQDLKRWMPVDDDGKPYELEYRIVEPNFD